MPENPPEKRPKSSVLYTSEASVLDKVPLSLRVAGAWAWRIVVVGIILIAGIWAFTSLTALFVPLVIALIIAAPLERLVTLMEKIKFPRALGSLIAIVILILIVAGLGTVASAAFMSEYDDLRDATVEGFDTFVDWLVTGPISLDQTQVDEVVGNLQSFFEDNAQGLASGALSVGSAIGTVFAGIVIALVALFFFMRDGRQIWHWTAGLVPDEAVDRVEKAGLHSWITLRRYTQTTVFVAFIDAVGIGAAAWILGVPLALPIAILVFLFSFIPLIGATLSGVIAALVALVDGGWTTALLMLAAVLIVQQIEGNVLYPWLFGKAASIHPLAVLLTISAGTLTLGLIGAVIAVPVVATLYAFKRGLRRDADFSDDDRPPITSQIPVLAERSKDAVRRARGAISRTGELHVSRDAAADGAAPDSAAPRERGTSEVEPHSEQIPTRGSDSPER
ncbi:AI-2E family transporter [Demequina muriae]|uniref:AI-2E family transporter n=1 Tax=Demequina muriae TaxID=3051664 RepID=A0ABT8GF48_9MICO|nr:AI-2E family transporter [Demequina sp. EGI L300058]MDN4480050.1 AI-2E family transporter [Demequina sp. EGI L300058]